MKLNIKKKNKIQTIMVCGNKYNDRKIIIKKIINKLKIKRFLLIKIYNTKKIDINFFDNKKIRKKSIKKLEKIKYFRLKNQNKIVIFENRLQDVLKEYPFLVNESDVIIIILYPNLLGIKSVCKDIENLQKIKNAQKNCLHIVTKGKVKKSIDFMIIKIFFYKKFKINNVKKINFL